MYFNQFEPTWPWKPLSIIFKMVHVLNKKNSLITSLQIVTVTVYLSKIFKQEVTETDRKK